MIGDRVNILPLHEKKAEIILAEVLKKYKKDSKFILAITGVSGTGKTECAYVIQEQLYKKYNIKNKVLHLDDYYKTNWHIRNKVRKETDIIGKEEIMWEKFNKVLKNFKNNEKKLYIQRIHMYIDSIEFSICNSKNIDLLIVEGLYALYGNLFDYGVYLDGNPEDTFKFRANRGKENPENKFRKYVVEREYNSVCQSKSLANLVIPFNIEDEKN